MRYYDHYHDPNTHLQLGRQWEDELLRAPTRRHIWSGMLAHLRDRLRRVSAQAPSDEVRATQAPRATGSRPGAAAQRLADVDATVHSPR
jgi:hypothetical protein